MLMSGEMNAPGPDQDLGNAKATPIDCHAEAAKADT